MLNRRTFTLTGAACLTAPAIIAPSARAQAAGGYAATARALDQLQALVVRRGGEDLLATAWRGPGLARIANVKSVSKTLVALLTGIAIERGHVEGVDQRILPMLGRGPTGDARDYLTVGDLLSMRAGLASTSGGNYGTWVSSGNWVDFVLDQDLVSQPGGRFIYSTGGWHVLGAALARSSGMSLHQMADDWLGAPLGVDFAPWVRDPQGRYLGGNDMGVSPQGLARIGEMVLARGRAGDRQVVPSDWIDTSWQARGRSPFSGDSYGYGWFLTQLGGYDAAYGRGYGGQILAVVPPLDLVIAITSDPTLPARSGGYFGELRALMEQIVTETAQA